MSVYFHSRTPGIFVNFAKSIHVFSKDFRKEIALYKAKVYNSYGLPLKLMLRQLISKCKWDIV